MFMIKETVLYLIVYITKLYSLKYNPKMLSLNSEKIDSLRSLLQKKKKKLKIKTKRNYKNGI